MFKHTTFLLVAVLLCFTACEEDTFDPVLRLGNPSAVSAPGDGLSFVLTEATAANEFTTFNWSAADFGVPTGVNYTIQMDVAGSNFADPAPLVPVTTALTATLTEGEMNTAMINKGLPANIAHELQVRIKAVVGNEEDGNVLISSPITMTVTPFMAEIQYPVLQVPGSHQGWDPAIPETVIYDVSENGVYDGYLFFPVDGNEFKFTDGPSWDVNYGDTGVDGALDRDGDNIVAGNSGLYRLNVDINELTYTATRTDWGLIGDATPGGWDADTDMAYDVETGIYSLTVDLTAGEIKFRANDAWDVNFGDTGADLIMEYGGDNIPVAEAGNYTIELLLNRAVYSYRLTKN